MQSEYVSTVLKIVVTGLLGIALVAGSMAFFPQWWNGIFTSISGGTLHFGGF